MVKLRKIDRDNFWKVIVLKVEENQEGLVISNAVSIAQTKVQPEGKSLAIYENETPVDCIDREDDEYWIYRFMIDYRFQSRGLGRKAMQLVMKKIKKDTSRNKIYLGVDSRGIVSKKLYESMGFKYTGEQFGQEEKMVLHY